MWFKQELQTEVRLWRAVIKRAILDRCGIFEDSKILNKPKKKKRIIREAEQWFKSDDFMLICDFANIIHTEVLNIKRRAVEAFYSVLKQNSTILSALLDRVLLRYKGETNV